MKVDLNTLYPQEDQIPKQYALKEPLHQKKILINGEFIEWKGPCEEVYSPIYLKKEGEEKKIVIGSYPICTVKESELALDSAIKAFDAGRGKWPSSSVKERILAMERFVGRMMENKELIVKLIMWEICKSAKDAEGEFDRTVTYIKASMDKLKEIENNSIPFVHESGTIGQFKKLPYGVVLCMGPFNYPLNETFATLIPALLMGNTILFKPPKHGTLLFTPLLEAFKECFPKGVVNTIYGRGRDVIPPIMQKGSINVIAFIGSSKVANGLIKEHPKANRLHEVLSLDAKNVAIIDKEVDLDRAVKESITGSLSFNGQRCTALKLFYVHQSIADQYLSKFSEELNKRIIGMPWDNNVGITPLAEPKKPIYIKECIEEALANGAQIVNKDFGGGDIYKSLVNPAIIYPVNKKMRLYYEEQFGPIIPIIPYDDIEVPINHIIDSNHGQQVSIFSTNENTISHVIDSLCCSLGRININSECQRGPDTFPFGGRKDSAESTLSITDALYSMSVDSVIAAKEIDRDLIEKILEKQKSCRMNNRVIL